MASHRGLEAVGSAPAPVAAASPRIRSMMERRGEFGNQVEFEIAASRDHWSELESNTAASHGEAEGQGCEGSKSGTKRQQFRVLRQLGELLFCCKRAHCSACDSQAESLPSLGRFWRRLGRLWACGVGCRVGCAVVHCGMRSPDAPQHGSHLECVELEEAEDSGGEETNREIFESLRKQWGEFFSAKWGEDLELGSKIAEGGQAEIFEVEGVCMEFVVKAFKKGYSLRSLQIQWLNPEGHFRLAKTAIVFAGTVLKDDRFALVMHRYWGDLRKLLDVKMQHRDSRGPPFPERQAVSILLQIAAGMEQLHRKKIPHRDLKASNVLVALNRSPPDDAADFPCVVADYECSVGVAGTGFWRAPEVLVAVRDRTLSPATFTPEADVYSFAMTAYEVLTGWVPFEDLGPDAYDAVVRGRRPPLPHPMNSRVTELLCRCWHSNPAERPPFAEIASVLDTVKRSYDSPPPHQHL